MTQSIARYLVSFLLAYLVGHGVITKDIADQNDAALTNYVLIAGGIVGTIIWSYLEKQHKGVLDKYFPPGSNSGPLTPTSKTPLLVLAAAVVAVSLGGCAGNTFSYTPTGAATPVVITGFGAWCENNLAVIRSSTKASIVISSKLLIKQSVTAARIAGYVRSAESALQPLLGQSQVSTADLDSALAKVKVHDADGIYANAISPAIDLVAGYIVQLSADGVPEKVILDVLTALNGGLNDAAVALDPTTT